MAQQFEVGDVVCHKTKLSQKMTVNRYKDDTTAVCNWIDKDGEEHQRPFDEKELLPEGEANEKLQASLSDWES